MKQSEKIFENDFENNVENKKFVVSVHANDGAVMRVLGLIDRRGHRVVSLNMHMPTTTTFQLDIEVEAGTSRQDILIHQIKRLADVFNVLDINPRVIPQVKHEIPDARYSRHDAIFSW